MTNKYILNLYTQKGYNFYLLKKCMLFVYIIYSEYYLVNECADFNSAHFSTQPMTNLLN